MNMQLLFFERKSTFMKSL